MLKKVTLLGILCLLLTSISFLPFDIASVAAQEKNKTDKKAPSSAKVKGERTRDASADDPEIKVKRAPNATDAETKYPAPPAKGGARTRGERLAKVHIDNRTSFYIDIYLDGEFRGTAAPYDDLYGYVEAGDTRFYGKAEFNDGSVLRWGPTILYCAPNGVKTWSLTY